MQFAPSLLLMICVSCNGPRSGGTRTGSGSGFGGIAQALERGDAPKTTSVLVMRGDTIVYEQYFNGATAATLHDTRSATKSLTALAVGIAIDRRTLPGLDAPAFAYLSDLAPFAGAGPIKDAITIEDLLTMSSALDCNDDDDQSPGNEENMYPKQSWARWAVDRRPTDRSAPSPSAPTWPGGIRSPCCARAVPCWSAATSIARCAARGAPRTRQRSSAASCTRRSATTPWRPRAQRGLCMGYRAASPCVSLPGRFTPCRGCSPPTSRRRSTWTLMAWTHRRVLRARRMQLSGSRDRAALAVEPGGPRRTD